MILVLGPGLYKEGSNFVISQFHFNGEPTVLQAGDRVVYASDYAGYGLRFLRGKDELLSWNDRGVDLNAHPQLGHRIAELVAAGSGLDYKPKTDAPWLEGEFVAPRT